MLGGGPGPFYYSIGGGPGPLAPLVPTAMQIQQCTKVALTPE